jgi:MFS family permease
MKFGQFLIVPFLAIYLSYFSWPPIYVGIIIAAGPLSQSIASFFTGHILDRYNPQQLFSITLLGTGVAYECLYESRSLICFILLNAVIGIFRAIFDNSSKTLLATKLDEQQIGFALGVRYAILNLAAALGPLIGAGYAAENSSQLFHLIACSYFLISLLLLLCWSKKSQGQPPKNSLKNTSVFDTLRMIKTCPSLRTLFLISFICYSLYSQITASLSQYLTKEFAQGISIYSNMLILNAITCVLLQLFISPFLKKIHYLRLATAGLSLLAIGFLGFFFAKTSLMFNLSMLILSMGEVIFFPLNDTLLAKIAPPHMIASYYGVLNTSTIGLAVGPILGGILYQIGTYYLLFLICSLCSLSTILLYKKLVIPDRNDSIKL